MEKIIYCHGTYKTIFHGQKYKGIGSSGMTDGIPVEGTLDLIESTDLYLILRDEKGQQYAIYEESIKEIK